MSFDVTKILRPERTIGASHRKRRYDIPLDKSAGSGFLTLLVGLMAFLAVMSLASALILSSMTARWSSGLENNLTVEIPAKNEKGEVLERDSMHDLADKVAKRLEKHPIVSEIDILSDEKIIGLISPWLGTDILSQDVPIPSLISIQIDNTQQVNLSALEDHIQAIAPQARLDTHQEWLSDIISNIRSLQFLAAILATIIILVTVTAVAGGVKTRMAIHSEDVELLHLMGAPDKYIARQFQRHSFLLSFKGAVGGTIVATLFILLIMQLSSGESDGLIPALEMSRADFIIIATMPLLIGIIAIIVAGRTVKASLEAMP